MPPEFGPLLPVSMSGCFLSTCKCNPTLPSSAGGNGEKLQHKNLISVNLGFGSPVQRADGFWESNYTYSVDDATYSVSLISPTALWTRCCTSRKICDEMALLAPCVSVSFTYLFIHPAIRAEAGGDPTALTQQLLPQHRRSPLPDRCVSNRRTR